jgi:hypothetical protein
MRNRPISIARGMTFWVFVCALGWLMLFDPWAPFSREVGVCEAGAVRDVLAGNFILPSYDPRARFESHHQPWMPREREWGPGGMVQVPPLYWWFSALTVQFLGLNEFALRLPSILAAAATCALLYAWTASVFDRRIALWAVMLVLLCKYFVENALSPRMDMLFVLFFTGANVCLERASAAKGRERAAMLTGAAACIALGTMSKGPAGWLLPGLTFGSFLLLGGRWRELVAPGILITFVSGLSIWFIWCIAAYRVGGNDFVQWQIIQGLALRFLPNVLGGDSNCRYEPYIYAKIIFSQCLPWSLFLPAMIALLVASRGSIPEPLLFVTCWFFAVFAFFTASSGRCTVYVLPCVPPMAVMLAYLFEQLDQDPSINPISLKLFKAGSFMVVLGTLALLTLAAAVLRSDIPKSLIQQLHPTDRGLLAMLRDLGLDLYFWIILSSMGVVIAVSGGVVSNPGRVARGLLLISLAGTFLWFHSMVPALAQRRTFKGFASVVDSLVPPGAVIEYLGADTPCDLRFYLVHQLNHGNLASTTSLFVIMQEKDLGRLDPRRRAKLKSLANSASTGLNSSRLTLLRGNDLTR